MNTAERIKAPSKIASRVAAHRCLMQVIKHQHTLDQAIAGVREFKQLAPSERAFAQRLAKNVLRYYGALDGYVAGYLRTPLKDSRLDIALCLKMGAVQAHLMEIPAHATVDTTVELAKHFFISLSGLTNAVMKQIVSEKGQQQWQALDHGRLNTPDWLWKSWQAAYGEAEVIAIAKAHLVDPPIDICVKKSTTHQLGESLWGQSQRLPNSSEISAMDGFDEGDWWVQEAAATLPVHLLGDIKGLRVLDACAAPGGKTMQLIDAGANVVALDQSKKRLKRLWENLHRTHLKAQVVCDDLLDYEAEKLFDVVVLDSPCSATGTLRRHPEILLQRSADDVNRLTKIQRRLIKKSLSLLKPEGRLLYITCSLQPEEGEQMIAPLKGKIMPFDNAKITQITNAISDQGTLRTLPTMLSDKGGLDGFFAAMLKK